jgi:hypothetical protein
MKLFFSCNGKKDIDNHVCRYYGNTPQEIFSNKGFKNRLAECSDTFKKGASRGTGKEISFKAEKKEREISNLFSKQLT